MLYACDLAWWRRYSGAPGFPGLKLGADPAVDRKPWGVRSIRVQQTVDRILTDRPGVIGWGGNSGFHALNLAVQFGARRIVLVGYDMQVEAGLHWHGAHEGMNNPSEQSTARWRRIIDAAAPDLALLGVEVINASAASALTAYPKTPLMEALHADHDLAVNRSAD